MILSDEPCWRRVDDHPWVMEDSLDKQQSSGQNEQHFPRSWKLDIKKGSKEVNEEEEWYYQAVNMCSFLLRIEDEGALAFELAFELASRKYGGRGRG